jgi:hypothetical protein
VGSGEGLLDLTMGCLCCLWYGALSTWFFVVVVVAIGVAVGMC